MEKFMEKIAEKMPEILAQFDKSHKWLVLMYPVLLALAVVGVVWLVLIYPQAVKDLFEIFMSLKR